MGRDHRSGREGLPVDDVSSYPASAADMRLYKDAGSQLAHFKPPVLVHGGNPHERLFVCAFDGTGNDKFKNPLHATNVAKIDEQVSRLAIAGNHQIAGGYVPGPGTQEDAITRTLDGAIGYTYEARVEKMYQLLIQQAAEWRREDPHARIRLADIGFSRGADEAASFARFVHEHGIQDFNGATYTRDSHGRITRVEYTKPPLVPPGKVAQVVGLFDPVGTGAPVNDYDRRLPPSVISGFQIFAKDEHRGMFKSDHIIDPDVSPDGRFLGVRVPGAHSDVGGSYLLNGLSIRSGNLMVDYLNALSDRPFLEKSPEPIDPRFNVVHRSTQGNWLYRVWHKVDRLEPDGYNTLEAPKHHHHGYRVTGDPYNAEPRDDALSQQFDFRNVAIGPVPASPSETVQQLPPAEPGIAHRGTANARSTASVDAMIERLYQAALKRDNGAMDAVADDYLQSPQGADWWRGIQQCGQAMQMPEPAPACQGQAPEPMVAAGMQR
ncbi:T6SS phospholipase effector Tle1-like catalytic domain-containing protein [Frateuria terrea]|uniref:Uncharacterized alpha/beta hydrolase domain n=1 Tax=Frateuria terrea TaxID=529704 RepID=A0A1H6Y4M9_9GAMM|nr:DUF2235 domain-containing protein [Frateuria terrea]SEJ33987.1 Uncharacterized alpha/beta hydrolase domain [Frateuria terrea]SFP50539.1 Uncharacterized alpha/beta hydrolase domain [Frateuria terrea]